MSLENILNGYKQRLEQINNAVNQSAAAYAKSENDLKQHLANHNALLGAKTEAENVINVMSQTLPAAEVPPSPDAPVAPEGDVPAE